MTANNNNTYIRQTCLYAKYDIGTIATNMLTHFLDTILPPTVQITFPNITISKWPLANSKLTDDTKTR